MVIVMIWCAPISTLWLLWQERAFGLGGGYPRGRRWALRDADPDEDDEDYDDSDSDDQPRKAISHSIGHAPITPNMVLMSAHVMTRRVQEDREARFAHLRRKYFNLMGPQA